LKSGNKGLDESEKREEQSCDERADLDISLVTKKNYEFLYLSKQFANAGNELFNLGRLCVWARHD
jgi:hypothetical protein